jgi:REP element-mobilizing transposase RayT
MDRKFRELLTQGRRTVNLFSFILSVAALGGFMHKHLPSRWDSTDAWYFVTVVTHERYPYFESKEACRTLMDACHSVWGRHRYRLGALVLMPDHWHALIKPQNNEVIEFIVGSIKQRVFHASRQDGADSNKNAAAAQRRSFVGKSGLWTIGSATKKITSNISNTCV